VFENPIYLPLKNNKFDSVQIDILYNVGNLYHKIKFNTGKLYIVLHLRKLPKININEHDLEPLPDESGDDDDDKTPKIDYSIYGEVFIPDKGESNISV